MHMQKLAKQVVRVTISLPQEDYNRLKAINSNISRDLMNLPAHPNMRAVVNAISRGEVQKTGRVEVSRSSEPGRRLADFDE
jgi:hypothetical protein